MTHSKVLAAAAAISMCLLGLSAGAAQASGSAFQDVPVDYWGYTHIQWAVDNAIVDGYPDGTFKPGVAVSQSEFLAMLIRAVRPADFTPAADAAIGLAEGKTASTGKI